MTQIKHWQAEHARHVTRRWFLRDCGVGLGAIALQSLLSDEKSAAAGPSHAREPHFPAKVKRVVYLFHAGAPSQLVAGIVYELNTDRRRHR